MSEALYSRLQKFMYLAGLLGYAAQKWSNNIIPATSLFRTGFVAPGPCGDTAVPTVICSLHAEYALTLLGLWL